MARSFHVDLIQHEGEVFSGDVVYARIPGANGYFGVMAHHASMVAEVTIGEIILTIAGNEVRCFAVGGGVAETGGNKLTLLVRSAEPADSIDVERAQAAADRARARLAEKLANPDTDVQRAAFALARAYNRLQVAGEARM